MRRKRHTRWTPNNRQRRPDELFAGMTQYDGDTQTPAKFLVEPPSIDFTFGQLLAEQGLSQLVEQITAAKGAVIVTCGNTQPWPLVFGGDCSHIAGISYTHTMAAKFNRTHAPTVTG